MATAVSFKSESGDAYIFAMDSKDCLTVDSFCDELAHQWWISEPLMVQGVTSCSLDVKVLRKAVSTTAKEMREEY